MNYFSHHHKHHGSTSWWTLWRQWLLLCITILLTACGGEGDPALSGQNDNSGQNGNGNNATMTAITTQARYTTLPVGYEQSIQAIAYFDVEGASLDVSKQVTWRSLDESIATVSEEGVVNALAAGPVTIEATLNDFSSTVELQVVNAQLTSLSLTPSLLTMPINFTYPYEANANYLIDGVPHDFDVTHLVEWSVGNDVDFSISEEGVLTSMSNAATADVEAVYHNRHFTSVSAKGFVSSVIPTSVTAVDVQPDGQIPMIVGGKAPLKAMVTYQDSQGGSHTIDGTMNVDWQISTGNGAIEVSEAGIVTAKTSGTDTVKAELSGMNDTVDVTVTPASLQSIRVFPNAISLPAGLTEEVQIIGTLSDGTTMPINNNDIDWTSSEPLVFDIDGTTGKVIALSQGTGTLTAYHPTSNLSATAQVTVTTDTFTVSNLTITEPVRTPLDIPLGLSEKFAATATLSDGNTYDVTSMVTWSSTDDTVATISTGGSEAGEMHTVKKGAATIEASLAGEADSKDVNVTDATLERVVLTPALSHYLVGGTQDYSAMGSFSDGSTGDVTADTVFTTQSGGSVIAFNGREAEAIAEGTDTIESVTTVNGAVVNSVAKAEVKGTTANIQSLDVTHRQGTGSVPLGVPAAFNVIATLNDGTQLDVTSMSTWVSNTPTVADNAPYAQGALFATLISGSADITATLGTATDTTTLNVTQAVLSDLVIVPTSVSTPMGIDVQVDKLVGYYSDGTSNDTLDPSAYTWHTSDPAVATVANGVVSTVGPGHAEITAEDTTNQVTSTPMTVHVTQATLQSLSVTPPGPLTLQLNKSQQFQAEMTLSNGQTLDGTNLVNWSSSQSAELSIDDTGLATGLMATTGAKINASLAGVNANEVTVDVIGLPAIDRIEITPNVSSTPVGLTVSYEATAHLSDQSTLPVTNSMTAWGSSDTAVMDITADGTATALAEGQTTISGTHPSNAQVVPAVATVTAEQIDWSTFTLSDITVNAGAYTKAHAEVSTTNQSTYDVSKMLTGITADNSVISHVRNDVVRGDTATVGGETAMAQLGSHTSAPANVTVNGSTPPVDRIELTPDGAVITASSDSTFSYVLNAYDAADPQTPIDVTSDPSATFTVDGTYITAFDPATGVATAGNTISDSTGT
ncbi:Ig-like domain-containing protein, partial [Vibrio sp. Isolate25]|uniref:Ig-like domain-containing protein n=1 Tax=Vibrio sp. Isolate25 TaxID=2908535 RepID=UPI001EFDFEEA